MDLGLDSILEEIEDREGYFIVPNTLDSTISTLLRSFSTPLSPYIFPLFISFLYTEDKEGWNQTKTCYVELRAVFR